MGNRVLKVINQSAHQMRIIGTHYSGDDLIDVPIGTIIEGNQESSCDIGEIREPMRFTPNCWGWIYLEDMVNSSQIELFAYVDNQTKDSDHSGTGWRSWNCDGSRDPNSGIRIADSCLDASHDGNSFTFTIGQMPTESYMFNMGRYQCGFGPIEQADHVFVAVRNYNGEGVNYFDCYGGHGANPDEQKSLDPFRVSCRGDVNSLRLAKAICCLDPDDSRTEFGAHDGGALGNGDSSGLFFGYTGVCHQMANRIFSAGIGEATSKDALDFADVRMGNATRTWFGPWGGDDPISSHVEEVKRCFSPLAQYVLSWEKTEELLAKYSKDRIPLAWESYFEFCKNLI